MGVASDGRHSLGAAETHQVCIIDGEGTVLGERAAELCRRIEVPVSRITEIPNVRRAVTGDTALRPGRFFGTSGEF